MATPAGRRGDFFVQTLGGDKLLEKCQINIYIYIHTSIHTYILVKQQERG